MRSLVAVAALALPLTVVHASFSDASAKTKPKAAAKKVAKKSTRVASGKCGEFMFRQGGKCVDARAKPSGSDE
jgi:uncharacterized low-complexity protein